MSDYKEVIHLNFTVKITAQPDRDGFYEASVVSGKDEVKIRALSRSQNAAVAYVMQEAARQLLG